MAEAVARLAAEEELGWYGALRAAADGTLEVPGYGSAQAAAPPAITGSARGAAPALEPRSRGAQMARWRRIWASTKPASSVTRTGTSTRR
jgi:hypothetical protein